MYPDLPEFREKVQPESLESPPANADQRRRGRGRGQQHLANDPEHLPNQQEISNWCQRGTQVDQRQRSLSQRQQQIKLHLPDHACR